MRNLGLVLVAGIVMLFSGCKKDEKLEAIGDYLTRTGLKSTVVALRMKLEVKVPKSKIEMGMRQHANHLAQKYSIAAS